MSYFKKNKNKLQAGFSFVELLIAASIIMVAMVSFVQIASIFLRTVNSEDYTQQAAYLAQEGMEAVRSIRDISWTNNILPLTNGTTYYLSSSSGQWLLVTSDPGPISEVYQRTVVFSEVRRDSNDNITTSSSFAVDNNTRQVVLTIIWNERGATSTLPITTYITNYKIN